MGGVGGVVVAVVVVDVAVVAVVVVVVVAGLVDFVVMASCWFFVVEVPPKVSGREWTSRFVILHCAVAIFTASNSTDVSERTIRSTKGVAKQALQPVLVEVLAFVKK